MSSVSTIGPKRRVGIACDKATRVSTITRDSLVRLDAVSDVVYAEFDAPTSTYIDPPPYDADAEGKLATFVSNLDALVVSKGCPRVTAGVLDAGPNLQMIGDLRGDRLGRRIDLAAASERGVCVVDTTNGSSDPVSEWALGLMLVGLRNAGALFRRLVAGELLYEDRRDFRKDPGFIHGELTGKTVGLIAFGYIGRRLVELLEPFRVDVLVHDPYAPRLLAEAYDVTMTSIENVMARSDVVVCLAPLTAGTRGLVDARLLDLLQPGSVFVNVSRGAVVNSDALVARLERGDVIGCLDVFDPEPIPVASPLRAMPNVFLTPHIAGVTAQAAPRFFSLMVDDLLRCFAGYEMRHVLVLREQVIVGLDRG